MSGQLPPDTNLGTGILAEYWVLFIISLLLLLLRSYVRLRVTKCWGWDDTLIVLAFVFFLINFVLMYLIVQQGVGRHIEYLSNPKQQSLNILKYNVFFQVSVTICTLLTKFSIGFLIIRIKDDRTLKWILLAIMSLMTAATIAVIVVEFASCIPLRKLWTPEISGHCIAQSKVYVVAYVQSGFNIITDLCLTISPIVILWKVRISTRRKVLICGLMSLGLTATISTALRNVYTPELTTSEDFTYAIVPIVIVVILEMGSGIIAACVPAVMPIMKIAKERISTSRLGLIYQSGTNRSRWKSNTSRDGGSQIDLRSNAHSLDAVEPVTYKTSVTTVQKDIV